MSRLKVLAHDRSLRGHVQRQVLFTPLLGVEALKKGSWTRHAEEIRKRFCRWVFRMRTAWPSTETVMQMQCCFPSATLVSGRKLYSCRRTRFCPWCFARQTAGVFDLLSAMEIPSEHVMVGFRQSRRLFAEDNDRMSPALKRDCVGVLTRWVGDFRSDFMKKTLPSFGAVINHSVLCTTDYNVTATRFGVAIVSKAQVEIWIKWQNAQKQFKSEKRYVRVFEDTTPDSIAKAVVSAFKFPKRIFTITPDNLALVLRSPKRYRFLRTTGACYSNPGLKKKKESTNG